jgi:hypothetical protein
MKKMLYLITVLCSLFLFSSLLHADPPLQSLGPFDISGTITEAKWYPAIDKWISKGGRKVGGSYFPAHFIVKLVNYEGISAANAARITKLLRSDAYNPKKPSGMPPFIILKINSRNQNYLKEGMKISVSAYVLDQYEGKILAHNKGVEIK